MGILNLNKPQEVPIEKVPTPKDLRRVKERVKPLEIMGKYQNFVLMYMSRIEDSLNWSINAIKNKDGVKKKEGDYWRRYCDWMETLTVLLEIKISIKKEVDSRL